MAIYDITGGAMPAAYDSSGFITNAYDIDGVQVFPDSPLLKVMTYNVGGWYAGTGRNVPASQKSAYYALQTGMIEANDPDILVIQEYLAQFSDDGTSALTMLQSLFPYVHAEVSGTYFGRAVCSKYPITNYTKRAYTQEADRYFDSCTVTVNDIPITVVTTHLGLTLANRTAEITQLISFLQTQERFVAGGDYNLLDCKSVSGEDYTAIMQPLLNAGFNCANCADFGFLETYSDQPTGTYTGCLDNIVTSSNIVILSAHVDETKLYDGLTEKTDHMPLIATLQIN